MARLPQPGSDNGNWGTILNDFLLQAHKSTGALKDDVVTGAAIQNGTITEAQLSDAVKAKLGPSAAPTRIDVRDYGAVGDGVHDDSVAIKQAESHLTNGSYLYFPAGDYRFAQQNPAGRGAIVLSGLSNVGVVFDPGARLLIDNLDQAGHGTSHGIRVVGKASHVMLINPHVEWKTAPSERSFGDGISVLGFPDDGTVPGGWTGSTGTVSYITVINPTLMKYPQAGIVFNGVSDPTVIGSKAIDGLADSLHFNACRRITVNGHHSVNCADDGLAFVTYYHPTDINPYGQMDDGPFNQSSLTDWCNSGSASGIVVQGNRSNGVRVQMAKDLSVGDITVIDKQNGVIINSAKIGPGNDWQSLASRNVTIDNVAIKGSGTNSGIVIGTFLIDADDDPIWWDFQGCRISNVSLRLHNAIWALSVETPDQDNTKVTGFTLENIHAEVSGYTQDNPIPQIEDRPNGGIRLASLYDATLSNVKLVTTDHAAGLLLLGAAQQRTENVRDGITYNAGVTVEDLPRHNLIVDKLIHRGPGNLLVQDIGGIAAGDIMSYDSDGIGVTLFKVRDMTVKRIHSVLAGRGGGVGRGANILMSYNIDVDEVTVETDSHRGSLWQAFELGGGTANYPAGKGVRVEKLVYTSTRNDTASDVVIQTGPYAPSDWHIRAYWRHEGETNPSWRLASYGDGYPVSQLHNPVWIDGPVDFNTLTKAGVYIVAGEFLNGPPTTYNQPGDTGLLKLTVTAIAPRGGPAVETIQEYMSVDGADRGGQRRKFDGSWSGWMKY